MIGIRINVRGFRAIRRPASVGLLVIGLVARAAAPGLTQTAGTWSMSGSTTNARDYHTATLLHRDAAAQRSGARRWGQQADPWDRRFHVLGWLRGETVFIMA
jgi:hypothetical protein